LDGSILQRYSLLILIGDDGIVVVVVARNPRIDGVSEVGKDGTCRSRTGNRGGGE